MKLLFTTAVLIAVVSAGVVITSPSPEAQGGFGSAVAVHGNTIVVGAGGTPVQGLPGTGKAYIYKVDDPAAPPVALSGGEFAPDDYFGAAVAVTEEGNVLVGAEDASGGGTVDVFAPPSWDKVLTLSPASEGDGFGASIYAGPGYVLIGAPYASSASGRVWLYSENNGEFGIRQEISAGSASQDESYFGAAIAGNEDTIIVGAWGYSEGRDAALGQAVVYSLNRETWTAVQDTVLVSPDPIPSGSFGAAVGISGKYIAVGEWGNGIDGAAAAGAGAVHIFSIEGLQEWTHVKQLGPPGGGINAFGWSLSFFEDVLLVGAPLHGGDGVASGGPGAAYAFTVPGYKFRTSMTGQRKLGTSGAVGWSVAAGPDNFGMIGAFYADVDGNEHAGAVYIGTTTPVPWVLLGVVGVSIIAIATFYLGTCIGDCCCPRPNKDDQDTTRTKKQRNGFFTAETRKRLFSREKSERLIDEEQE